MIIAAAFPKQIPETGDIIILGAHVSRSGLSSTLESRLAAGAEYAKKFPEMSVYVSGGQGLDEPVSEARAMRDYLVSQGIDAKRIIMEDESHNTYENLINTRNLLFSPGDPVFDELYPVTIVTSEFHVLRTSMLAARAGFHPYFIPARTSLRILPSCFSREFFGLIKSFLMDR